MELANELAVQAGEIDLLKLVSFREFGDEFLDLV